MIRTSIHKKSFLNNTLFINRDVLFQFVFIYEKLQRHLAEDSSTDGSNYWGWGGLSSPLSIPSYDQNLTIQGKNQFLSPITQRNLFQLNSAGESGHSNCPKLLALEIFVTA
jgi:hypothetical protein